MKYNGMPAGMWLIFNKQFRNSLMTELGYDMASAKRITDSAKLKYRSIIEKLPEFEKGDRFRSNIPNYVDVAAVKLK